MTTIHFVPSELLAVGNKLATTAKSLTALIRTVSAHGSTLSMSWSGAAFQAFVVAHNEWIMTAGQLTQLLADAGAAVEAGAERYQQTEKQLTQRWEALRL